MFRAEVDISFKTENDAVAFLNLLQTIKNKAENGTGEEPIAIVNKCRYHECFHDQIPPKPCGNYVNYDLSSPTIEEIKTTEGVKVEETELIKTKIDNIVAQAVAEAKAEPIVEEEI